MITITLTYRNRDLAIVKKCLNSLLEQSKRDFKVVLVNYGSNKENTNAISQLVKDYPFLRIINCKTQGQLWCKSRAINIVLKQCKTPYFFVGDVDMIYHPEFVEKLDVFKLNRTITYFQVGFLNKEESNLNKAFKDYNIKFKSSEEATGMTLFKTEELLSINGYDEFYNGWGSEDTDVHVRLKKAGFLVNFHQDEVLMLHQWHAKQYRTKESLEPFHAYLEQINQGYLELTEKSGKTKANIKFDFGVYNDSAYEALNNPEKEYGLANKAPQIKAFINNILLVPGNSIIRLNIKEDPEYKSLKQKVKGVIGKKTIQFLDLETINNMLLETIITNLRNCPYKYKYNQTKKTINLVIKL